jgi:hypothetical protein
MGILNMLGFGKKKQEYQDVRDIASASELGKMGYGDTPRQNISDKMPFTPKQIRQIKRQQFYDRVRQQSETPRFQKAFNRGVQRFTGYRPGKLVGTTRLAQGIARSAGARLPRQSSGSGSKHYGRGRPRGTYKYFIPGKGPVGVFEWRKWYRQQRRLQQLMAQSQISQTPSENQQIAVQNQGYNAPQQQIQPQVMQQYPPQLQQIPVQPQPPRDYNILHAPNPWKGQLRNVGQNHPVNANVINSPVANPQGDQYTEIDVFTGRPRLVNRVRERWLS